jgi:hypothetical protein
MTHEYFKIPADPEKTAIALQSWSSKRVELASERIYDAGKFLFTVSSASIGILVTLMRFSNIPSEQVTSIWWSLIFFLVSAALTLGVTAILYFEINGGSDLKKDFLNQQLRYHWILFF